MYRRLFVPICVYVRGLSSSYLYRNLLELRSGLGRTKASLDAPAGTEVAGILTRINLFLCERSFHSAILSID